MMKLIFCLFAIILTTNISHSQKSQVVLLNEKEQRKQDSIKYADYQTMSNLNLEGNEENKNGNYDKAISIYNKGLEMAEGRMWGVASDSTYEAIFLENIANVYKRKGDLPSAMAQYNHLITKRPNSFEYYNDRGDIKMKLEDYRGALLDFNKAIENEKKAKQSFYTATYRVDIKANKLYCLLSLKKDSEALLLANDLINLIGDCNKKEKAMFDGTGKKESYVSYIGQGEVYYLKGIALYNLKKVDDSCTAWSKSGELGYKDAYVKIKDNCNK